MKSLPFRKGEQRLVKCQECGTWRPPYDRDIDDYPGWEQFTLYHGEGNVSYESTYYSDDEGNYRRYYDSMSECLLTRCNDCYSIITNDYDGDEFDNQICVTGQAWKCTNCDKVWPGQGEADACCT